LYEPSGELQRRRKEDEKGKSGRLIKRMTRLKNERKKNSMNKGGSQRRENLNIEKSEAKKNVPQCMLQTVNG